MTIASELNATSMNTQYPINLGNRLPIAPSLVGGCSGKADATTGNLSRGET